MKLKVLTLAALFTLTCAISARGGDALDHWYLRDSRALTKIRFIGGQFVGVGTNGTILTSPDGRVWSARNSGTSADLRGVAWGNLPFGPGFVAVGTGATILISSNAVDWRGVTTGYSCDLNAIIFSGSCFVAATTSSSTNIPNFLISAFGTSWSGGFIPWADSSGRPYIMDALNGTSFPLIAAGSASLAGDIWRSWDGGYTWEKVGFSNQIVSDISYGNSRYVMVGVNGYPLFSTNYGDSWSFSTDTNICNCHGACCYAGEDIAFGLSIFVVARNGQAYPVNGLLTTGDGVTWTNRIALAGLPLSTIAFGNDTFVVAGRSGIYRSEISAPILTARLLSSSNAVDLLISGEFGRSYRLQTSTNFSSWDDVMSFTNQGPPYEFVDPIQPNFSARFYRVFSP